MDAEPRMDRVLHGYALDELVASTRFSDVYRVRRAGEGRVERCVLKIHRNPARSACELAAYSRLVRTVGFACSAEPLRGLPDGLLMRDLDGYRPLSQILEANPEGLDDKSAGWIALGALRALATAHSARLEHGNVLADNVMVSPETRSVRLVGWSSAQLGEIDPTGDVWDVASLLSHLLSDRSHDSMRLFRAQLARPRAGGAAECALELADLLDRLCGPRRYEPFQLSGRART